MAVNVALPIWGGNWGNGSNAGLAYLNLMNRRSNVNNNIGLRPALLNVRRRSLTRGVVNTEKRSRIPSFPRGKENMNRNGRQVYCYRKPPVSLCPLAGGDNA
jgi:hypothetical protein